MFLEASRVSFPISRSQGHLHADLAKLRWAAGVPEMGCAPASFPTDPGKRSFLLNGFHEDRKFVPTVLLGHLEIGIQSRSRIQSDAEQGLFTSWLKNLRK